MKERILFDRLVPRAENKYSLCVAIARRARQIHDGDEVTVESDAVKPVTMAIHEFAEGKLLYGRVTAEGVYRVWPSRRAPDGAKKTRQ